MNRMVLGGFIVLLLVGLGLFWWEGRAEVERAAPPPEPAALAPMVDPLALPTADPGNLKGPAPPVATELTKEEQRFFRYDRNRDRRITRAEMLSTRTTSFRGLDKDGNNLLTFEEWAVATVDKFEGADADGNRELSSGEFATTKPKSAKRRSCAC